MDGEGSERFDAVIVGAGQAGLTAGYYLKKAGRSFVILDEHGRLGDNWRERYDSLRLFTPAHAVSLPGRPFPAKGFTTPLKDDMARYLEEYATELALPVRTGLRVDCVRREGDTYVVTSGAQRFEAANVVIASGAHREGRIPALAAELDPGILQVHSTGYRNPSQLRDGGVLVVGAGNSGADIALEVTATHPTWLAGPTRGSIPFDIDTGFARHVGFRVVRFVGVHMLTQRTPLGRRVLAKSATQGDPLVRVKPKWLDAAGVLRVGKVLSVREGLPVPEDGEALDVANVIWCTGFRHDLSWIDLPIFGDDGLPMHERGVVASEPGLYFLGLPFQFALASDAIPGVGRDTRYVIRRLLARERATRGMPAPATV